MRMENREGGLGFCRYREEGGEGGGCLIAAVVLRPGGSNVRALDGMKRMLAYNIQPLDGGKRERKWKEKRVN